MDCDSWWHGGSEWIRHTPTHYRYMIRTLHRWYGVPILGTENGVSGKPDWLDIPNGNTDDWWRKRLLVEYIGTIF